MIQMQPGIIRRHLTSLGGLAAVSLVSGVVAFAAFRADDAQGAGYVSIAMLAGVGGNVSTLACYDPDPYTAHPTYSGKPNPWAPCRTTDDSPPDFVTGNHSGQTAPTDIANGGSTVYVQNDYLPSAVRGGYLYPEDLTTGCYDPSTSGGRTKVWIYYYDGSGYTDVHAVYYGHIDQDLGQMDTFFLWNNSNASSPLFQPWVADYILNNEQSGGMPVGSVRTSPTGCVTGAHLHQETNSGHSEAYNSWNWSEGCWYTGGSTQSPCTTAGYQWIVGRGVTGRYSDIHYLNIYVH